MNWITRVAMPGMSRPAPAISLQEAHTTCIGPFYHGTTSEAAEAISSGGFWYSVTEDGRNGYPKSHYTGAKEKCILPVHHLGFGVYLTQSKPIAKMFGGSVLEFWLLKNARIGTINFASPNTMLAWWKKYGYNCELAEKDRAAATQIMTENLQKQFDAILFKGKGYRAKLLDGNQVCIYNLDIIRRVDKSLTKPGEIGSKVVRKQDGMKGVFMGRRPLTPEQSKFYHNGEPEFLTIKWQRGGTDMNVYPSQVDFV